MSKHYRFHHTCGHIGIGPLIRTIGPSGVTDPMSIHSSHMVESINMSLSIRCPFCANNQPYLQVTAGDGLLAILDFSTAVSDGRFFNCTFEWRILRVCQASDISSSDWYLAHAPGQHYRQMAWIPKPCGAVKVDRSDEVEDVNGFNGLMRQVDCSWRQTWHRSQLVEEGIRSRIPGMWSNLKASMMSVDETGEHRR